MAFDEVRLPTTVEKGALGGPTFNTTVKVLSNGYEQRNQNWSTTKSTRLTLSSIEKCDNC